MWQIIGYNEGVWDEDGLSVTPLHTVCQCQWLSDITTGRTTPIWGLLTTLVTADDYREFSQVCSISINLWNKLQLIYAISWLSLSWSVSINLIKMALFHLIRQFDFKQIKRFFMCVWLRAFYRFIGYHCSYKCCMQNQNTLPNMQHHYSLH